MASYYKAYISAGFDYTEHVGCSGYVILRDEVEIARKVERYDESRNIQLVSTTKLLYAAIADITNRLPDGSVIYIVTTNRCIVDKFARKSKPTWRTGDWLEFAQKTARDKGSVVKVITEEDIEENPIFADLRHRIEAEAGIPFFEHGYICKIKDRRAKRKADGTLIRPKRPTGQQVISMEWDSPLE